MKKLLIRIGIAGLVIYSLIFIFRVTGLLALYNNPTPSNEPTLKTNKRFLVSNLPKAERGDFIIFKSHAADSASMIPGATSSGGQLYVKRLCGIPGDQLQMKEGVLYVNGKNFDENLRLKLAYIANSEELQKAAIDLDSMSEACPGDVLAYDQTQVSICLEKKDALRLAKSCTLTKRIITDSTTLFTARMNPKWSSADNWGPLTVPADQYFVLGDNRDNSLDSRYFGFVAKKEIKGVLVWHQ